MLAIENGKGHLLLSDHCRNIAMGRDAVVCLPCWDTPILRRGAKCEARIFCVERHFDSLKILAAHTPSWTVGFRLFFSYT